MLIARLHVQGSSAYLLASGMNFFLSCRTNFFFLLLARLGEFNVRDRLQKLIHVEEHRIVFVLFNEKSFEDDVCIRGEHSNVKLV